jgi:hypothetical protein
MAQLLPSGWEGPGGPYSAGTATLACAGDCHTLPDPSPHASARDSAAETHLPGGGKLYHCHLTREAEAQKTW